MEWITTNFEWIIAAIALLFSSGIIIAIKMAIKETKEAWQQGEKIYKDIQKYKKDGFTNKEISDLMRSFEVFYKEGKEAYAAVDKVWKLFKKAFNKNKK